MVHIRGYESGDLLPFWVPMTFEPEKEGGFMLNIWHKSPILVPARPPSGIK